MSEHTPIEWTDHSWSPWWGCTEVSEACRNCYARTMAQRFGFDVWGRNKPRRMMSEAHWRKPLKWNAQAEREGRRFKVFPSMCDPFEVHPDLSGYRVDMLGKFLNLCDQTPALDWLLLTKRPEVAREWSLPPNAWLGVTVENQEAADERIPLLLEIPAARRFVSYEPALGPVELGEREYLGQWACWKCGAAGSGYPPVECSSPECDPVGQGGIDWAIAGCESGPKARPADPDWFRRVRDECQAAGVPFFLKQMQVDGKRITLPKLDGRIWDERPEGGG